MKQSRNQSCAGGADHNTSPRSSPRAFQKIALRPPSFFQQPASSIQMAVSGNQRARGPELSIIVPTIDGRSNIIDVISAVSEFLSDIHWEILFVDDSSPDDTAGFIREIARKDARIRCLQRFGRKGVSSAFVEGIMATSAHYVAVMRADRRHDEHALRRMVELLRSGDADIVVARCYGNGAEADDWSPRAAMSRFATRVATFIARAPLDDPMSSLFMFRREAFLRSLPKLSSTGAGLLVDIFASSSVPLKVMEVYSSWPNVNAGSKPTSLVLWAYFLLLLDKVLGRYISIRFISFALIGGSGVIVHFSVLSLLFKAIGTSFVAAQIVATMAAMSSNFFLNNALTYGDQRLTGRDLLVGWISFNLVCATSAVANVGIASFIYAQQTFWVASALAGIAVGAVWNYAMSSIFTWRN